MTSLCYDLLLARSESEEKSPSQHNLGNGPGAMGL